MTEPKDNCILCQIVAGNIPSKKVYEDENTLVVLDINGASLGHCFVMPKKHYPILEQVPDEEVGKLFSVANKVSAAIFETMGVQGTNIFVTNGVSAGQMIAHFMINVIPRNDNDGINLNWPTKKLDEEEMSTVELRLKEHTEGIGIDSKPAPQAGKRAEVETISDEEENYLLKQLRRIP